MELLPSLRMTANLNALVHDLIEVPQAAAAITADDVAHHVLDPESVLGLDPLTATDLETALASLKSAERDGWALGLPTPGQLRPLRGPRHFNEAALQAGEVVIATSAELGLVPFQVGRAVQWRLFPAKRPFAAASPYEAERALNEAILAAARALTDLDLAAGRRPPDTGGALLAPGYSARQVAMANRTLYLLLACDAALHDDGASLSSYEANARSRMLRTVRVAAGEALCATCSWIGHDHIPRASADEP
ncbi:MAG: hypothetical protein H0T91_10550 [Propionibacteriaceae bacterium]|nr:hypothetical protein [Propionibacteriaceae bacterium]